MHAWRPARALVMPSKHPRKHKHGAVTLLARKPPKTAHKVHMPLKPLLKPPPPPPALPATWQWVGLERVGGGGAAVAYTLTGHTAPLLIGITCWFIHLFNRVRLVNGYEQRAPRGPPTAPWLNALQLGVWLLSAGLFILFADIHASTSLWLLLVFMCVNVTFVARIPLGTLLSALWFYTFVLEPLVPIYVYARACNEGDTMLVFYQCLTIHAACRLLVQQYGAPKSSKRLSVAYNAPAAAGTKLFWWLNVKDVMLTSFVYISLILVEEPWSTFARVSTLCVLTALEAATLTLERTLLRCALARPTSELPTRMKF